MSKCTVINAHITDQVLQLSNLPRIASGSKKALQIRCNFCGKWEGCGKMAVFYRDETEVYHRPVVDGLVTVPWEVLVDEGHFWFGFMGQDDLTRTTEVIRVEVVKGALTVATAEPQEPTPDIYQQLVAAYGLTEANFTALEARFDEVIAMRSEEGTYQEKFGLSDPYDIIKGTITSNGIDAYIGLRIIEDVLDPETPFEFRGVISPQFAPLAAVELKSPIGKASVWLYPPSEADETQMPSIVVDVSDGYNVGTYSAFYPLAKPFIAELADIRLGKHGDYDTAGDAMRAEIELVEQTVQQITEEHLVPLEEAVADVADLAGGKLDGHDVEGYAFAVSDEEGNVVAAVDEDGKWLFADPEREQAMQEILDILATLSAGQLTTVYTEDYAWCFCDEDGNVCCGALPTGEKVGFGDASALEQALQEVWDKINDLPSNEGGGGFAPELNNCGLPVLYLEGDTDGMSKENKKTLSYKLTSHKGIGQVISSGTCECKWQGSSSVANDYPKRNYTIKITTGAFDATLATSTRRGQVTAATVGPWGAQEKYCLKANWIDPSVARNVVCAKLWGAVVASRGYVHEKLAGSPNCGAIDGFPIILVINGEFEGLYTFNIPKEGWMFGMGSGDVEYIVAGESNSKRACGFYDTPTFIEGENQQETDFAIEYQPDGVEDATVIASFQRAVNAVKDAPDSAAWEEAVADYFDIDSAIDYYIFNSCISGVDNLRKNILYATYDGKKWFMSAYDMDTTLGSNPYGTGLFKVKTDHTQFLEGATGKYKHRLFELIYNYSHDRLKARWEELRVGILSDANVWYVFNNFVNLIPRAVYNMDAEKWADQRDNQKYPMPATTTANVENYMQYYRMHCALLDKEMEE